MLRAPRTTTQTRWDGVGMLDARVCMVNWMIVTKFQFLHNLDYSVRCIRSRGIVSWLLLLLRSPFVCILWAETHFFRELFSLRFQCSMQIWWRLSERKRHSSPVRAHDNDVEDGHVPPHSCAAVLVESAAQAIHIEWRAQKRQCGLRAANADANTNTSTPTQIFLDENVVNIEGDVVVLSVELYGGLLSVHDWRYLSNHSVTCLPRPVCIGLSLLHSLSALRHHKWILSSSRDAFYSSSYSQPAQALLSACRKICFERQSLAKSWKRCNDIRAHTRVQTSRDRKKWNQEVEWKEELKRRTAPRSTPLQRNSWY